MKHISKFFFIFSTLFTPIVQPQPSQQLQPAERQGIRYNGNLVARAPGEFRPASPARIPRNNSSSTIPSPPPTGGETSGVLSVIGALIIPLVQGVRYYLGRGQTPLCKHGLPVNLDQNNYSPEEIENACQSQHKDHVQTEEEAYLLDNYLHAVEFAGKYASPPPPFYAYNPPQQFRILPFDQYSLKVLQKKIRRDSRNNIVGLADDPEPEQPVANWIPPTGNPLCTNQNVKTLETDVKIQQYVYLSSPEVNATVQELYQSAQESIKRRKPLILQDTLAHTFASIDSDIESKRTSYKSEHRGDVCKEIQTRLVSFAWDHTRDDNFAQTINAAQASMFLAQTINETGPVMYTNLADQIIKDVCKVYSNYAFVRKHKSDPEIDKEEIFGSKGERLYLVPYLEEELSSEQSLEQDLGVTALRCVEYGPTGGLLKFLLDKFGATDRVIDPLLQGVGDAVVDRALFVQEFISNPIGTTKKIVSAARKILCITTDFITSDCGQKLVRNLLLAQQLATNPIKLTALVGWEKQALKEIITDLSIVTRDIHNLTSDDIQKVISHVTSKKGLRKIGRVGGGILFDVLAGRAAGGAFSDIGNLPGGATSGGSPGFIVVDGVAIAIEEVPSSVGILTDILADVSTAAGQTIETALPISQVLRELDGNGKPQQRPEDTTRPPIDEAQRVEKIVQDSQERYNQAAITEQHGGRQNNRLIVTKEQIYRELAEELKVVQDAERKLAGIEGVEKVITSFETTAASGNFSSARGAAYELEETLKILQKGETIIGINIKKGIKGITEREIDIISRHNGITFFRECKNRNWNQLQTESAIGRLQSSLGQQRDIAQANGATFVFHSKQPIPAHFKGWLDARDILHVEG